METLASLSCPDCGFRVFNRRYPKCESCGALLPQSIVYSAAERARLFEAERLEREEHERVQREKENGAVTELPDELLATEAIVKAASGGF